MRITNNNATQSKAELSAAAILFDENNDRGFKTTAHRHISPEVRPSRPTTNEGHRKQNSRSIESFNVGGGGRSRGMTNVKNNFAHKNRQAHFADPKDYGQINYEKRIRDLSKNKVAQTHLSSKVIETWINETLADATHLDIPGILLKPENKKPLERYGICRN